MPERTEQPENCNATEEGVGWLGYGVHKTDSKYLTFGSTHCRVARVKVWMRVQNFPGSGLQNSCLNSSCPFNTEVPTV
jgi:hypothetical protein